MICVLENFFYDQRPKIAIFPKAAICHLPAFWFWWCKMAFLPSTVHRITWMMIDGLWLSHLLKAEPVSSGSSGPLGLPFHAWRRPFFPYFFDDFPFWKHVCMFSLNHRVCASGHSSKFCCEHLPCVHNTVSLFLIYVYSCLFRFRLNPCVMLSKVYADSPLDMLCESLTATFPLESILRLWFSVFLWRARYFKGRNFYTEPCLKVAISLLGVRWWILICVMNIWGPAWREVLVGRATRAVVLVCEKRIYPKSCQVWPGFRSDWPEICGFHSFNIWAELDMIWPWLFNTLQLAAV